MRLGAAKASNTAGMEPSSARLMFEFCRGDRGTAAATDRFVMRQSPQNTRNYFEQASVDRSGQPEINARYKYYVCNKRDRCRHHSKAQILPAQPELLACLSFSDSYFRHIGSIQLSGITFRYWWRRSQSSFR